MVLIRNLACSNRTLYLYLLFASLVFAAVTILIHLFIERSHGFNLVNGSEKLVVEDLTRIKASLRSELRSYKYADDISIWKEGVSTSEIEQILQNDIKTIENYCQTWCIALSDDKTTY
jgi:hypothetical protein